MHTTLCQIRTVPDFCNIQAFISPWQNKNPSRLLSQRLHTTHAHSDTHRQQKRVNRRLSSKVAERPVSEVKVVTKHLESSPW